MPAHAYAKAAAHYQGIGVSAGVNGASPHQLIDMLLRGALDRVAIARGAILRGDVSEKARRLSTTVAIVQELAECLNLEQGGETAQNLYQLYDYIMRRLVDANRLNDEQALDEITALLTQLHLAWEQLPTQMARAEQAAEAAA